MAHIKIRCGVAAAALAAAALAGCHDDHNNGNSPTPPPSAAPALVWSTFVEQVFSNAANTTPINLDGLTFDFDVDDDPTAFNGLLM
jgi:hypothetical protein